MKNVLFVGEHPLGSAGNSGMMRAILSQVDTSKYNATCFGVETRTIDTIDLAFKNTSIPIISAADNDNPWGYRKLLDILQRSPVDFLVMVGIDIWRYWEILHPISQIRDRKKFKWIWIFPWDLQQLRFDWIDMINLIDYPCVYSRFGEKALKDHVPNLRYFRPSLQVSELWKPMKDKQQAIRNTLFPTVSPEQILFGVIGVNQVRKDPQGTIKAFSLAIKEVPNILLYLHMEADMGVYNIKQYANDCGMRSGELLSKNPNVTYRAVEMVKLYNALDCLVNCSMQEGLSWTPLEAMLCGVPVIGSETTAQTEMLENGAGMLVPCEVPAYVPLRTKGGESWINAKKCNPEDIAEAMIRVAKDEDLRKRLSEFGLKRGQEYLAGVSNINLLLDDAQQDEKIPVLKNKAILFMQHSAAGDVLMTTQCFKGIKEKHPGIPLVYMTQKQYHGIVENNPHVDKVVDWDKREASNYEIIYSPHAEHILPGGFNNLDTRLHEMYPYFCNVRIDQMFIRDMLPETGSIALNALLEHNDGFSSEKIFDYIVVHTTGGDPQFRTYKHIDVAMKGFDLPIVQIGGLSDFACKQANIDLRGKLSWEESAWVMKHAKAAVVVDSFPSHLAGALGTPVVVLFGPAPARVVGPRGDPKKIINIEPNKLKVCKDLTNCWGTNKACTSPCINTISPMLVKNALRELLDAVVKSALKELLDA